MSSNKIDNQYERRRSSAADPDKPRSSSLTSITNLIRRNTKQQITTRHVNSVSQITLNNLNVEQDRDGNKHYLDSLGGAEGFATKLDINLETGLTSEQVKLMSETFGYNDIPSSPKKYFLMMLLESLSDPMLLVLLAAATVSFIIGIIQDPQNGWIEGAAIFLAIALVAFITSSNDYSKELQFRALERSSLQDDKSSVVRSGVVQLIKTSELVVGDIVKLQAGDMVPADCILISRATASCNESALTGEPEDVRKSTLSDPFLLSSCLITESEGDLRALVVGIGMNSQWGKIKSTLVSEPKNTPLQDKLEDITTQIGYIGIGFAVATFVALGVRIWISDQPVLEGLVNAFILAVTIIVVAIPEGLPLAVAISLAYSTQKMYREQCFIRVLAACETMGNATNICSDKTGTLTQNRMTVVEGWLADTFYEQSWFVTAQSKLNQKGIQIIAENAAINRTAYYVSKRPSPSIRGIEMINIINSTRYTQHEALVVGSKTEASLMTMLATWSLDADILRQRHFDYEKDKVFPFDSHKKRSTAIIHRDDGTVRVYVKGASEYVLHSCTKYLNSEGEENKMNDSKRLELEQVIHSMAKQALRTLVLAHKDIEASQLPPDWEKNPPDTSDLCCDCVLGIIDPIRPDVVEAVSTAQKAGIVVRMVTGDSLATAAAIARQCGILDGDGICMEGPTFRNLTPSRLDEILPRLRVLARSSPDDKRLLVMRLNGHNLPEGKEQWEAMHKHRVPEVTWEQDRELLLPGYVEEWSQCRRHGGDVVGVTGDGTNDAPALKVADVGLSMGVTGTKVAQEASDIVILDDRFSSIVNAIRWGRGVYDNIRKFLQFQLTVNIVALTLVFISAVSGYGAPLNAVMMLWVNLIMDTFGALALSTETPSKKLLERKPYRRSAGLISRPMWRNILVMGTFQLIVVLVLLFAGPRLFGVMRNESCMDYQIIDGTERWSVVTNTKVSAEYQDGTVGCNDFKLYCPSGNEDCYYQKHLYSSNITVETFQFSELNGFSQDCLVCKKRDYRHGTLIFNAFIFCQVFNEYVARKFDEVNMFSGMSLSTSPLFLMISVISVGAQVFLVELGGEFLKTTPLTLVQWLITVALGALTLPVGVLMRFIPVHEDPKSFFDLALVNSADDDDDEEEEEEVITFTPRLKQTPFDDSPQRGGLLSKLAKYAAGKDNRTLPV